MKTVLVTSKSGGKACFIYDENGMIVHFSIKGGLSVEEHRFICGTFPTYRPALNDWPSMGFKIEEV